MRLAGIDPGASGAVAVFDTGLGTLHVIDMPVGQVKTGRAERSRVIPALFANAVSELHIDYAVIELVGAMPKQGLSSTFTFGHAAGVVEGVVAALGIPYEKITPQEWQKLARVSGGKDGSRARAAQLYPAYAGLFARKKDDGRADAACMAYAGAVLKGQA